MFFYRNNWNENTSSNNLVHFWNAQPQTHTNTKTTDPFAMNGRANGMYIHNMLREHIPNWNETSLNCNFTLPRARAVWNQFPPRFLFLAHICVSSTYPNVEYFSKSNLQFSFFSSPLSRLTNSTAKFKWLRFSQSFCAQMGVYCLSHRLRQQTSTLMLFQSSFA